MEGAEAVDVVGMRGFDEAEEEEGKFFARSARAASFFGGPARTGGVQEWDLGWRWLECQSNVPRKYMKKYIEISIRRVGEEQFNSTRRRTISDTARTSL